jgi:hypothetical protein
VGGRSRERAVAENLAIPVVAYVTAGQPPAPLGRLSPDELTALVVLLAEVADPGKLLAVVTGTSSAAGPDNPADRRYIAALESRVQALTEALESAHTRQPLPPSATRARKRPGPRPRWERPDDGIVDEVAVDAVVCGERALPLSRPERLLAARKILSAGGGVTLISERLHVSNKVAAELAAGLAGSAA